jgi:hypothetical protein
MLVLRVHRATDGSVYVLWPGDPDSDPHTSYHASGKYWQKTDDQKLSPQLRQKLDSSFRGSEMVVSTGITTGEAQAVNVACDPAKFTDVFEIAAGDLKPAWRVCLSPCDRRSTSAN